MSVGREAKARATREQDCVVVKIVHDPKTKKTKVDYTPANPSIAAQVMTLALSGVIAKLGPLAANDDGNGAKPHPAGLIAKPSGLDQLRVEKTRARGTA